MLNFKSYLIEARNDSVESPSDGSHVSSLGHMHGADGTAKAMDTLTKLHDHVKKGKVPPGTSVMVDGYPSLSIAGPSAQSPYGSVSILGSNIISRTHEDIDAGYGDDPLLADRLKDVYDVVAGTVPPGMKIIAKLMHTRKDVSTEDIDGVPHFSFKSNLMKYAVPVESDEGQAIDGSSVGLAIESVVDELGRVRPIKDSELSRLTQNQSVHVMGTSVDGSPIIDFQKSNIVDQHLQNAAELHDALQKDGGYDPVVQHGSDLESYSNHSLRSGEDEDVDGFMSWVGSRGERKASEMKTPRAQESKREVAQAIIDHVSANKPHFENAISLKKELDSTSAHLSDSLIGTHGYRAFIGDQEVGPKGHKIDGLMVSRRRPTSTDSK